MCRLGHKFRCRVGDKLVQSRQLRPLDFGDPDLEPLLQRQDGYARNRGIEEIAGDVLQENRPVLKLCTNLGFSQSRFPADPGVASVTLTL